MTLSGKLDRGANVKILRRVVPWNKEYV